LHKAKEDITKLSPLRSDGTDQEEQQDKTGQGEQQDKTGGATVGKSRDKEDPQKEGKG
jgi:hypothetical protein